MEKAYKNKFSSTISKKHFLIYALFNENQSRKIIKKEDYIFDNPIDQTSYVYLGKRDEFDHNKLLQILKLILKSKNRNYQINVDSFISKKISNKKFIQEFIFCDVELNGKKFNLKTSKDRENNNHILLTKEKMSSFKNEWLIANQLNEIKYLQNCAPNILTINKMCDYARNMVKNNKKISLTILEHNQLSKLSMNLINSVNLGSKQKVKVLVLEYKPSKSTKKITFIGKGIIFDSGGYNLKTGKYMQDMKYDMSGAAIALLLIDTISKLHINKNISCVIPLTDNLLDSQSQVPESIWTSMSGKTIEVANTDAEGRLILADAITYSAKKLKSTLIIDIATLTGTVLYALGKYSGVWSTNDKYWDILNKSAINSNELIWRMPLNDLYIENLNKNTFADMLSCSNTEYPDSNIAAAWLNQFALGVEYIHLDIAGTADEQSFGKAPLFKTLISFVNEI